MTEPRAEQPDMSDYGVGGPDWAPLPWSWAAERLLGGRNFWVVTADAAGRPHAMPVWGVWDDGDWHFAFSCSPNSRKARNLAVNDHAVVMADSTVECISVEGRATAVEDPARADRWVARYLDRYRPLAPELTEEFVRGHLLVEFSPERALAVIEREDEFADRATRWVWPRG